MAAKRGGPIEKIEDIFIFPAPGSHEEQFWSAAAVARDEFAPDVQDGQVIFLGSIVPHWTKKGRADNSSSAGDSPMKIGATGGGAVRMGRSRRPNRTR